MNALWTGLWLLSSSWLFGVDYFFKGNPTTWGILLALGTTLSVLAHRSEGARQPGQAALASFSPLPDLPRGWLWILPFAFVPATILLPWPHRLAPILMLAGLALHAATLAHPAQRWPQAAAGGLTLSGPLLLAQTLALTAYQHLTARSRELPWPIPDLLAALVRLLGPNAAADGSDLVLPTMRQTHRLAATWELFLDPATVCFLAAGFVLIGFCVWTPATATRTAPVESRPAPSSETKSAGKQKGKSLKPSSAAAELPVSAHQRFDVGPAGRAIGVLLLAVVLWLPLRAALHVGFFLHRALRTDYEAPLNLMNQFWSPWPQMLLLLPLVLLAARLLQPFFARHDTTAVIHNPLRPASEAGGRRNSDSPLSESEPGLRRVEAASAAQAGEVEYPRIELAAQGSAASQKQSPFVARNILRTGGLAFVAVALLTLAVLWDPIGQRKPGRIAVDEFHSKWEPTDRPMDTEWYGHLSGYNYACLYDYCSRYYGMSRLTNSLTDAALANLDVLILKVPTEPFQPAEIDAVMRYVERGGGLLLVGEHTDVFNTGYHLNHVSRRFGFEFRYDCLFGMESFFDQYYQPPVWRHPVLQHLEALDFATSCSIDARGPGRGVIVSTGLKNSMADYHANNYYPQAVDHASMRAGAFVQLWATRRGNGRVLAFTDSTIFSNFSAFEPGKSELFLGMLEWLNRQDRLGNPRLLLSVLGLGLLGWALWMGGRHAAGRWSLVAAGTLGWSAACLGIIAYQKQALPAPKPARPLTWVTIDRTLCDGPLSKGGFIAGQANGFGIFERWILRLGYFIKRTSGPETFRGDLATFFYPTKPVTPEFQQELVRYVEGGGRVLVLDSPANTNSVADALLQPFGLSRQPLPGTGGTLAGPAGWPSVPVEAVHEIGGGQPLFRLGDKPVGAVTRRGQGVVVALGFGSRFSDAQMGVTGDVEPDAKLRQVFDLQFALIRSILKKEIETLSVPAKLE